VSQKNPLCEFNNAGRDGSPSRPSSEDRSLIAHVPPTPSALSEKSPYQILPYRVRKSLPHEIPSWVEEGAVFFITINCEPRGRNQLATPPIATAIERSLHHQNSCGAWWIHLFLLMPDHLHGLISFSRETPMQSSIQNWKRFLARQEGIAWQRDFFDHRLRHDESLTEKWNYIRENPVREGLVATPDDWPYQWTSGRDGSPSRPSSEDRSSTLHVSPTAHALSEKSPYQFKDDGHLKKMGAAL
jgi:putative transposase